ncbi:hypothetical protein, partial [Aquifex sp.]
AGRDLKNPAKEVVDMFKIFDIVEEKYFSQLLISLGFKIESVEIESAVIIYLFKEDGNISEFVSVQLRPYVNAFSNRIYLETEGVSYTICEEPEPGHITHEDQKFFTTLKELVEKLSFPRAA